MSTTPDQFAMLMAQYASTLGWSLAEQETGIGVVMAFVVNDSPYGEVSSVHRSRARVAILTDVMTAAVLANPGQNVHIGGARPQAIDGDGPCGAFQPPPSGGYVCVRCGWEYPEHDETRRP